MSEGAISKAELMDILKKRAEFYTPPEKYFGFIPMHGETTMQQWWYHHGVFDNGWTVQVNFMIWNWIPEVWVEIQGPDGYAREMHYRHPPEDFRYVPEVCDITIGKSRIWGKWPIYEVHVDEEGFGCDLKFDVISQNVFMPPDGVYIGRMMNPATPVYEGYALHPRSNITGKLIMEGKTISVKGDGYSDHQWHNSIMSNIPTSTWNWGRINVGEYCLIWWDTMVFPLGYQHFSFLWCLKGKYLIEFHPHSNYYVIPSDYEIDPYTMLPCHKNLKVLFDTPTIKGTLTYTKQKLLVAYPLGPIKEQAEGKNPNRVYRRLLGECVVDLEILGEKVTGQNLETYEQGC